jgi:DNA-binding SARP family transcriptional activator
VPLGRGGPIVLQPKDAALLAVIALSGPVLSDHLAAMLWPTVNAKQADTNLRQRPGHGRQTA